MSVLGVGNIKGQITKSRLVCLTMVNDPSHASFFCLSSINELWEHNDSSLRDQKFLWLLSHLPTVGGETDMWPIFVKVLRSHHSATIRKGQIMVKYSSRGNASYEKLEVRHNVCDKQAKVYSFRTVKVFRFLHGSCK